MSNISHLYQNHLKSQGNLKHIVSVKLKSVFICGIGKLKFISYGPHFYAIFISGFGEVQFLPNIFFKSDNIKHI